MNETIKKYNSIWLLYYKTFIKLIILYKKLILNKMLEYLIFLIIYVFLFITFN